MKRIIALIIFCSLISVTNVFSQQGNHVSIQWDISFGMGDLGDYISKPSFRGASFQYRYAVTDQLLLGADAGWNVFYEKKEYDSYTSGTQTLSGVQYRYQNQVPLLVCIDYLLMSDRALQPYIGLGIGTMYSERSTDMGMYYIEENPWHFALKPEFGLMYEMSPATSFKLGLKYYTGLKAGELDTQGYLAISVGLAFSF